MNTRFVLSLVAVLLTFSQAVALDHRVEPLSESAPGEEISKEIAGQLAPAGLRVIRGSATTLCDIWLCKEWAVKGDFKASADVLYPFQPGQLVGVVRFARKSSDFRDQDIGLGVYTLRYAQQPVDGAHVGTSPTRDFLLLQSAAKDTSAAAMDYKKQVELSKEVAESTHPALLSMQRLQGEGDSTPSMRHDEERDWWILRFQGKAKAGDQVRDVPIELVVVGVAAE
jgi:hypothetical protein